MTPGAVRPLTSNDSPVVCWASSTLTFAESVTGVPFATYGPSSAPSVATKSYVSLAFVSRCGIAISVSSSVSADWSNVAPGTPSNSVTVTFSVSPGSR